MTRFEWAKIQFHLPRIVLGAVFVFSGLNGFLKFLPDPHYSPEGLSFIQALRASGIWWTLLKTAEVVGGSLLLSGSAGRFGVLILAPVTLAIVSFHIFLSPQGSAMGWGVFALELFLIVVWRKSLLHIFHHPSRRTQSASR